MFALADGSVRFISDTIETNGYDYYASYYGPGINNRGFYGYYYYYSYYGSLIDQSVDSPFEYLLSIADGNTVGEY